MPTSLPHPSSQPRLATTLRTATRKTPKPLQSLRQPLSPHQALVMDSAHRSPAKLSLGSKPWRLSTFSVNWDSATCSAGKPPPHLPVGRLWSSRQLLLSPLSHLRGSNAFSPLLVRLCASRISLLSKMFSYLVPHRAHIPVAPDHMYIYIDRISETNLHSSSYRHYSEDST